jgi:FkbM family methyltransferase
MKCAVIILVEPGNEHYAIDAEESVDRARSAGGGPFDDIISIKIKDTQGELGRSNARNQGVRLAKRADADWIFFLDACDALCPDAFLNVTHALGRYDAIWGAMHELADNDENGILRPGQLLEILTIDQLLANDPLNTLQIGHFVKTGVALAVPFNPALDAGGDFDYYLRIWSQYKCVKISKPFFYERRNPYASDSNGEGERKRRMAVERIIGAKCAAVDFHVVFEYRGESFKFYINNPFDLIHRCFLKGRFFEADELAHIESWVGTDATIVEVGAYVGNHVVYYSRFMRPRGITVFEPNPESIKLLRRNLDANGVDCADLASLGIGIAAAPANYDIVCDSTDNHGAARLVPAEAGGVRAAPLDNLVTGRVDFIKIDVEGMELDVLAGAQRLIAGSRPKIMIEVFRHRIAEFEAWMRLYRYRVNRKFENVHAVNFMIESAHE